MTKTKSLYESDLVAWSDRNAELLRSGRFNEIDAENVAEEIESLGRSDKRQMDNRIAEIIGHLLKLDLLTGWDRESNERGWRLSVAKQQVGLRRLFKESPSLRARLTPEYLIECYRQGMEEFEASDFGCYAKAPRECPWSWMEILK